MLFPTFTFFFFFVIVLSLNWALKKQPLAWRLFLLSASYIFYATWDIRFLPILAGLSILNFTSATLLSNMRSEKRKKITLAIIIILDILFLGILKYYDFFRVSMESFLQSIGMPANIPFLEILLPIGLSFYILRAISFNVDIFRGKLTLPPMLDFAIYIAFFPQLLSGPIMRPNDFLVQLKNGGAKTIENLHYHFALLIGGLFKKVVIASFLTLHITDSVFAVPENYSALTLLLAIYAFSIVIYCDFSAYSDMAIGIAGLMGFSSPVNFKNPYAAFSLQDFWRRWHITFSEWLKDYVYIPLGGNRKGEIRKRSNLIITMLVSGLWHGVGMSYIVWGALHGIGLTIQNLIHKTPGKILSWLLTFNFVCFTWIFFRSENLNDAFRIITELLSWQKGNNLLSCSLIITILGFFAFIFLEEKIRAFYVIIQNKLSFLGNVLLMALLIIEIMKLSPDIVPPFLYFQF